MNPKLRPLEKTLIQTKQGIKRLEVLLDTSKDEQEKEIAEKVLEQLHIIDKTIPKE